MKTKVITFMLLLHLAVPSTVKTEMCTCPGDDYYDPTCLRESLQAELTSTPTNIQQLQYMFYSNNFQDLFILTDMTVNITCEPSEFAPVCNSSVNLVSWSHVWFEDNIASVIRQLLREQLVFKNPIASALSIAQLFDEPPKAGLLSIQSSCVFRGEPEQVEVVKGIREIWEGILQWSKAYARAGGPVPAPSDSDKGQVYCTGCSMQSDRDKGLDFCTDCSMPPDIYFSSICLVFDSILNIVVGIILVLLVLVPSQIMKQNFSSATSSLLWSSAIIGAHFAFIFVAVQLYFTIGTYTSVGSITYIEDVVFASITIVLLFVLVTAELIVATYRSKDIKLDVPKCVGICCFVCCIDCFVCCICCFRCFHRFRCCCILDKDSHSRVARALALWFVMVWLQLIAASVVPVTITVLTTSPHLALAILATSVSTFIGMVVFLAVLIHMCTQHDRSKHCILCTYLAIFVGVLVMVCLAMFLILVINVYGVQVNSIPGFIGTLVPSAILSIITWFVKKKVFDNKPSEADPSEQPDSSRGAGRNC